MSRYMKRLTALLLVLCLVLAGCGKKSSESAKRLELSEGKLEKALQTIELSTLAAVAAADAQRNLYDTGHVPAYIGDIDGDGTQEFVCGNFGLTFDLTDTVLSYNWEQSGNDYYTDEDGNLYLNGYIGGDWEEDPYWMVYHENWYKQWDGDSWNTVMSHSYEAGYRNADDRWDDSKEPVTYESEAFIDEESVTEEEFNDHIQAIGLKPYTTTAKDLTLHAYDIAYQDQLLEELEWYLEDRYGEVLCHTEDMDSDGEDETVFLIPDLLGMWNGNIQTDVPFEEQAKQDIVSNMDIYNTRTGVILAETNGEKILFGAMCINGYVDSIDSVYISDDDRLHINNYSLYYNSVSSSAQEVTDQQKFEKLQSYLQDQGYSDAVMKLADVSDAEGQEVLCLCKKDNTWYIFIFLYVDGESTCIYDSDLTDSACYLVEEDGKECLLTYYQRVQDTGSGYRTYYNYNLLRFDNEGVANSLDYQEVSFTNNDSSASATADFFNDFNKYVVKVIVIADPFKLTNREWMEESDFGTIPQEEISTEQEEKGKLAFVQIEDPESWLNLREGPGTQYDRVLMDPSNPNSYVKQALGSPVTILEEVETGDAENPVWVKIRIHYGDREVVGYSSKRFIREAE